MGSFFTDGAADFAAVGADEFLEVFARLAQGAGDDERLAGKGRGDGGGGRGAGGKVQAGGAQAVDQLDVFRVAEVVMHAAGHDLADVVDAE